MKECMRMHVCVPVCLCACVWTCAYVCFVDRVFLLQDAFFSFNVAD